LGRSTRRNANPRNGNSGKLVLSRARPCSAWRHRAEWAGTSRCWEVAVTVILDHTIVLSRDKLSSALFLNYILGREYGGHFARFAPVRLDDELNIDYADVDRDDFERRTF